MNTEVANLALYHLGISKTIANIETEQSSEAKACRAFYDRAVDNVLRDYTWPFANKIVALNLISENPTTEWGYSYRIPSDCIKAIRIPSGVIEETATTRVVYKISGDDAGRIILTNQPFAELEYIRKIEDDKLMTPDFIMAFSFKLAHYMAPSLTGGDPFKLGDRASANYDIEISQARSNAYNEEQPTTTNESVYTAARI